ncbi:helix-turn-helix transcriptional regulator [Zhongshania sp. BJYM1]|jgi:DNA-binding CsgD family transcriptional regulator|uniref:helix-turn-helix transcriptional regulator n=1 Tax=Zhongshania aquatica TaxID=2965069 RepID=UPI0022B52C65|nr:LuxR C-terminal-related transcriptional regulator [Marortus sp. BJYM1]
MRHSTNSFASEYQANSQADYGRLVGAIYDCLSDNNPVQALLVLLAECFHAEMVSLVVSSSRNVSNGKILMVSRRSLGDIGYYEGQSIPLSSTRISQVTKSHVFPASLAPDDEKACKVYDLFLESVDFYNSYTVALFDDGEAVTLLKIGRGRGLNYFSAIERELIDVLVRHIKQFMCVSKQIKRVELERTIFYSVVEKCSLATIALDHRGLIVHVNQCAENLLRRTPEICVESGRIELTDLATQCKFEAIISRILCADHREPPSQLEVMRVSRDGHSLDLGLAIRPVAAKHGIPPAGAPAIAVFIRDTSLYSSAPAAIVSELFALSPMEARVALLLADGLNLVEISEFIGIAHATVRTHLRSVFKKMGVDRQALVVRLVLMSVACLA